MTEQETTRYTAFNGSRRFVSGELGDVAAQVKDLLDRDTEASVLIFDDRTARLGRSEFSRGRKKTCLRGWLGPRPRSRERLGVEEGRSSAWSGGK